ncbi:glycosyltransferase family 4 protein [archaeon]|nr:glycosyltransferase family 4 protein [archaeon]
MRNMQGIKDMQILIVTPVYPPDIGGPATYSIGLARELRKRGHHVKTVALSDSRAAGAEDATFVKKGGNKILRQASLTISVAKKAKKCDIVIGLDIGAVGLAAVLGAKIAGKPSVIRYVGDVAWERSMREGKTSKNLEEFLGSPDANRPVVWLQKFVFRNADTVVACSRFLKTVAEKYYAVPHGKAFCVYNAIDMMPNEKMPSKKKQNKKILNKERKIGSSLITVCRLVPWKRVDRIIRAMDIVRKKHPEAKLYVVGEGPELKNLKRLARPLGSSVIFAGKKNHDEALRMIAASEAFVLNSSYEGMSFALLEAMACRTPVICSDIPQNLEALNRQSGLVVPAEPEAANVKGLSEKIILVLENKTLARKLALKAYNRLSRNHSWEKHVEELEIVLNQLIRAS